MHALTTTGDQAVSDLSARYGVSRDAVLTLLAAVAAGNGTMAQFHHPDLGGGGQWMHGGMVMVGDMFNHALKDKVGALCSDLASLLAGQRLFVHESPAAVEGASDWWPAELGAPAASGGQNDARYAYFPAARRLAISRDGRVTVYDTLDHAIGGVQQQQGGSSSLSFTSQRGTFSIDQLAVVAESGAHPEAVPRTTAASSSPPSSLSPRSQDEVLTAIERLGALRDKGILSDDEFQAKKAELLSRI